MTETKKGQNPVGSSNGTRLYSPQPQYEIDPETGLYVVKEWKGAYSMADTDVNVVPNVSPTGKPVLPQWFVITLTVLASAAAVVALIPGVPVWVAPIGAAVTSIAAAFGVVSPGLRTNAQPTQATKP